MKKRSKKKIFAKGYNFYKIFTFFIIGCLVGTYWEEILWYIKYKEIVNRQGMIIGPFSPIYGFGVALFIIVLAKNDVKRAWWKTYIYSCLLGGFAEYLTSYIADVIFNVKFWDYSNLILNINGRTTIPIMLFWGLGGLVILKVLYPFISNLIEKIPYKMGTVIYIVFIIFIIFDMFITYGSLGRMSLRNKNVPSYTFVGEIFDKYFDDDYLDRKFPIMAHK